MLSVMVFQPYGFSRLTDVVRTPQSSTGQVGVGTAGVPTNSKSSDASELDFDIVRACAEAPRTDPSSFTNVKRKVGGELDLVPH